MVETTFSNFREGFHSFRLNYREFVHELHTKPSKYDSTSGTRISMFEKLWGDEAVDRTTPIDIEIKEHQIQ